MLFTGWPLRELSLPVFIYPQVQMWWIDLKNRIFDQQILNFIWKYISKTEFGFPFGGTACRPWIISVPQLTWVDQREKRYPSLEMWVVVTKWLPNCSLGMPMGRQQIWATFRQQMLTYQKISNFQNLISSLPSSLFSDSETFFLSYQRFLVN